LQRPAHAAAIEIGRLDHPEAVVPLGLSRWRVPRLLGSAASRRSGRRRCRSPAQACRGGEGTTVACEFGGFGVATPNRGPRRCIRRRSHRGQHRRPCLRGIVPPRRAAHAPESGSERVAYRSLLGPAAVSTRGEPPHSATVASCRPCTRSSQRCAASPRYWSHDKSADCRRPPPPRSTALPGRPKM
jgi:hypothetical protein